MSYRGYELGPPPSLFLWYPEPVSCEPSHLEGPTLFSLKNKTLLSYQKNSYMCHQDSDIHWLISGLLTFVYCKIQGQKHTVLSIQFLHPSVSPHAFTPVWLLSFSSSLLLRAPICFIIFINDVPFPLCHIRGSHLWFWWYCRSLGQLKVWDPIWSVSHKKTFKPQRLLRLQQTFNSCLNQVPVLWNMGLRETESLWAVSLHTDGSLSAQEKVVILFGKALKGKINEYSEWT